MKSQTKGLIAFLVVGLVGAGGYFFFNAQSKPKTVFAVSINDTYTRMADMLEGMRESKLMTLGDVVSTEGEMTFELAGDIEEDPELGAMADVLNGMGVNYNLEYDQNGKKMFLDLEIMAEDEKVFAAKVYAKDDLTYFFVEELFDKYIGIEDMNLFEDDTNIEDLSKEIEYLAEKTKDLLIDSMLDEYFETEETTVTINGEELNVTENTFKLDQERAKAVMEFIIKGLKDDEKAVDAIVKIADFGEEELTKEEVIKSFDEALADLEKDGVDFPEVVYSIYTEGMMKKVVKHDLELTYKDEYMDEPQVIQVVYDIYENSDDNSVEYFELMIDGEKTGTLEVVLVTDEKTEYHLEVFQEGTSVFKAKLIVESSEEEVVENKEYKTSWSMKVEANIEGQDLAFTINVDSVVKAIDEVTSPDAGLLVMYDDLTPAEQEDIQSQMLELMGLLGPLMGGTDYDYDYNDDYDYEYDYDDYDFDEYDFEFEQYQ